MNMRASERAYKIFALSHSKTAISFNILMILCLRNIFSGLKLHLHKNYTINAVFITMVWALCINDSTPTKH